MDLRCGGDGKIDVGAEDAHEFVVAGLVGRTLYQNRYDAIALAQGKQIVVAHEVNGEHLEEAIVDESLIGNNEGHVELLAQTLRQILCGDEFGFDEDLAEDETGTFLLAQCIFEVVLGEESFFEKVVAERDSLLVLGDNISKLISVDNFEVNENVANSFSFFFLNLQAFRELQGRDNFVFEQNVTQAHFRHVQALPSY